MLLAAFVAASALLFVFPRQDAPRHADAVIVLSGSRTGRLPRALALMRHGVAPVLVISDGRDPKWRQANRYCDRSVRISFHVICFKPQPYSTRGEAEQVGRIARARHWHTIVLVSSTYHLFRARMIFRRCFAGDIDAVGWRPGLLRYAYGVVTEWPKLAWSLTFRRGC